MKEELPSNPNTRKGEVRAQLADRLLEAHHKGALRAAIGRGSDFFGPYVLQSHAGERLFPQALTGKPAAVLGDPDKLHTFTYIDDFGKALVLLGEREDALGKAWHVPNAPTLTRRAFIERVYRMAGHEPAMRLVRRWQLSIVAPFNPMLREVKEMLYQLEEDFVVDSSHFTSAFGLKATPLEEALRTTLDWFAMESAQAPQARR
jgi:nucleoside-diphosphate-sugar epimerase